MDARWQLVELFSGVGNVTRGMQATPPVILINCQGVKWTSQHQVVLRLGLNIFLKPQRKSIYFQIPSKASNMDVPRCRTGTDSEISNFYIMHACMPANNKSYGSKICHSPFKTFLSHHRCASRSWGIDPARMWILGQGCSWDDDEKPHQPAGK